MLQTHQPTYLDLLPTAVDKFDTDSALLTQQSKYQREGGNYEKSSLKSGPKKYSLDHSPKIKIKNNCLSGS